VLVRRQEEEDERGDEQRRGGDGDLGLPQRRQEQAQRPRQALTHLSPGPGGSERDDAEGRARRGDDFQSFVCSNSKRRRVWDCGFLGNGGKQRGGNEGDRRKACHGQCAGAFKSGESGARAGSSSVRATSGSGSGSGWRRGAERCND